MHLRDERSQDERTRVTDVCPCPSPNSCLYQKPRVRVRIRVGTHIRTYVQIRVRNQCSKKSHIRIRVRFGEGLGHELMNEFVSVSVHLCTRFLVSIGLLRCSVPDQRFFEKNFQIPAFMILVFQFVIYGA